MKCKPVTDIALGLMVGIAAPHAWADPAELMDLIVTEGNAAICNHDYWGASATVKVDERNHGATHVRFKVKNAKPNHLHTVWLKLGDSSPVSGIGATPVGAVADLQNILDNAGTASASGANAFYTNSRGNGHLEVWLDFHLGDGDYPFSEHAFLPDVPIGHVPFTFRIISHCTDNLQHGAYPGTHEPTFQVSLP